VVSDNGAVGVEDDLLASAFIDAEETDARFEVKGQAGNGLPEKRQATNAVHGGKILEVHSNLSVFLEAI
jgi:hypothetical protein